MRVAIYGAGAMGTVFGAYIAKSGKDIDLISRNKTHVENLKNNGAHITGSVDFVQKVNALLPSEMSGEYDIVFLMTKQRENASTVEFIKGYMAPNGVIVTLQNGLPEYSVAEVIGKEHTLGCAVSWGATFVGNGEAKLTSSTEKLTFALGAPFVPNEKTSVVADYLRSMGEVTIEENFLGARWAKLVINSSFSALSTLTGKTFGEIANERKSRGIVQVMLNEAMRVAKADGVKVAKIQGHDIVKLLGYSNALKKAFSYALIPLAMKNHSSLVSGMYYDLMNGKTCDIDHVSGAVCAHGKANGTPTPYMSRAVEAIHEIERGERKIGEQNLEIFKSLK